MRESVRQTKHFSRPHCTSRFPRPTQRTAKVEAVAWRKESRRCPIPHDTYGIAFPEFKEFVAKSAQSRRFPDTSTSCGHQTNVFWISIRNEKATESRRS